MSHVTEFTNVAITNIAALRRALAVYCPDLEMVQQTHYRTYKDDNDGRLVGDWDLPEGLTAADVGDNAEYVIRVTDAKLQSMTKQSDRNRKHVAPYEIGVVPSRTSPGQYYLAADFWLQGRGVLAVPGVGVYDEKTSTAFGELYMYYRMAEDACMAEELGDHIEFEKVGDHWISRTNTEARLGY